MEESTCTEHYTEGLGMDGEGVTEILLSIVSINRKAHSQNAKYTYGAEWQADEIVDHFHCT